MLMWNVYRSLKGGGGGCRTSPSGWVSLEHNLKTLLRRNLLKPFTNWLSIMREKIITILAYCTVIALCYFFLSYNFIWPLSLQWRQSRCD